MSGAGASVSEADRTRGVTGLPLVGALTAMAVVVSLYAWQVTVEGRITGLAAVVAEIFALFGAAVALVLRDPEGRLRLSNPAVLLLGWMFYYFVKPALAWLQGYGMALESPTTILLDTELVSRVQHAHCYFILAFYTAYLLLAPRDVPAPFPRGAAALTLKPWSFIGVGLLPYLANIIERLATSGSVLATESYGDFIASGAQNLESSRNEGGAGYLITQIMSKVWYLPIMSFGVGLFLLLTRYLRERRRVAAAMLFAQVPLLLLLGNGGRSYTAFPFLIALILVDALSSPLPWLRYLPLAVGAIQAFNFYGVFRGFQSEGPTGAINASLEFMRTQREVLNTEDGIMLTKEAYCLFLSEHGYPAKGIGYFFDSIVLLLPAQIAPSKVLIRSTGEFLSDELLGYRRGGSGVAGTMIGDGFLIGGDLGVVVLAAVLGTILSLMMRWAMAGRDGPRFWRYALVILLTAQMPQYVRADLVVVLTQLVYYLVIPALVIQLLLGAGVIQREVWEAKIPLVSRSRR